MEKRDHRIMNNDLLLPSDLWLDIFLRLSVADLLSLKPVCKTFHQLISSDLFDETHLKDFTKQPSKSIIVSSTDPTASNLIFDPEKRKISAWRNESRFNYLCTHPHAINDNSRRHRVLDSYLGYLLVQICDRLCLCNPIKSSYLFLPSIDGFPIDFGCWKIGYDDVSEKYKVFGLKILNNKVCLYVSVARRDGELHLPKKTTTILIGAGLDQMNSLIKGSFLKNGNVHWFIVTEEAQRWGCIVSVNVATEEVKARNCDCTVVPSFENFFAANGTFYMSRSAYATNFFELWVLEGVESENPNPNRTMTHENPNPNPKWTMAMNEICAFSILWGPFIQARTIGVFRNKLLMMNLPNQQYFQYDLTRRKYEKVVMLERGDDTERKLESGAIYYIAATQPLGFIIPSNLV